MSERPPIDLQAISLALAQAESVRREPRCLARVLATPKRGELRLTLQMWIDLEEADSPLMRGEAPTTEAELDAAFDAFGLDWRGLEPEELLLIVRKMQRLVANRSALYLPMIPPGEQGSATPDGFGEWAPLYACLVTQCGIARAEARQMDVDEMYVLIAAHRRNEGWRVGGMPYAVRDAADAKAAAAEIDAELEREAANG